MPSPSVTAVSSSRWALNPCLGQDSLLTWTAPSCSGCWRSPMPSAGVACFSAAGKQVRGAEQQAYQQGELLRFPSWSLGLNWGSLAFVKARSNSVSVTFPQPRPEAILQWLCSYLFLVTSVIRSWGSWASHEMRSLWAENRPGSLQMPCVKYCQSPRRDRGPQSTPWWMPWKCWGKEWQKRPFKRACWTQESINMFMKKVRQALLCPDWGPQSFSSGHTPNRLLVFICICLKSVIHVNMHAFNDVTYNESVSHWVVSNSLRPYGL